MIWLFSDLDNTLIYSHRKNIGTNKIPVEKLNGKNQSFMTDKTYTFLSQARDINLVPVTTRTEEQYNRIDFFKNNSCCKYALVNNGGTLIRNGVVSEIWEKESMKIAKHEIEYIDSIRSMLWGHCLEKEHFHCPRPYFLYFKAQDPKTAHANIRSEVDLSKVILYRDARKIYVIAKSITKGNAVRRLRKASDIGECAAAGDGILDVSMAEYVDYIFLSDALKGELEIKDNMFFLDGKCLSDEICKNIRRFMKYGINV